MLFPSMGVLSSRDTANSQKQIQVIMKKQTDLERRMKDKFMIEALETLMNMNDIKEENLGNINVADVWKEKIWCTVKCQKIPIPISLIYSEKTSDFILTGNSLLKQSMNELGAPSKRESLLLKSEVKRTKDIIDSNLLYEERGNKFGHLAVRTTWRGGQLSVNSGSESRRNASLYQTEVQEVKDEGFSENYKQKYESLKKIADEQHKNIETIFNERDEYLNQINKLKFVYENKVAMTTNYDVFPNISSIKIWQMLLICVFFLILGSFISFIRTENDT